MNPNSEHEAQEADRSSQESSCETTKELFRRDLSPKKDEPLPPQEPPEPPAPTPTIKPPIKQTIKSPLTKRESATKKKSNSGIPLRLKSGTTPAKSPRTGTYRHSASSTLGPVINKNTLEVQFINNKKRLMQMHSDLVERQRPLMEMHKSLMRTKKQLEDMGKKVVLEDFKIISLKMDDPKLDGAGENPAADAAISLKSSIENALESCAKVCKKCFAERDTVMKILENASKSEIEPSELEAGVEELKKKEEYLEKIMQNTLKENEKKVAEVLENWQKTIKLKILSNESANKISDLEDTVKQYQKSLQEADDNLHSVTRKYEDKKATYEKSINELQEKFAKIEDELKKEKKAASDNLMKSRNLRTKMTELEVRTKDAEDKSSEALHKLKQLQEQMRKKEIQWMKEKDDFKKNEALLQQKFAEKQNQFDTRLKDMESLQKSTEMQQKNYYRNFETQLEIKDQEFVQLEKEKDGLAAKSKTLEQQVEELKKQLEDKDKELDELSIKAEHIPAIEYQQSETQWIELMEYKQKVTDTQNDIEQLNDQINKMQSSLKAHAKLAAALKLEKDNAIKYSGKLREVLHEAKEELEFKNKTIYKIHEKLVLKDKSYEKLKVQMKELEACAEFSGDKWSKNRCQICMAAMGGEKTENLSCVEVEGGKSYINSPQYVSESLIGMSVKKVDHLRARLDNLKKMKLPNSPGKQLGVNFSWSHQTRESDSVNKNLRKQIALRGKLYQILQKHADQSCEDFINLLKLTVSNGGKGISDELKPSNMKDVDETVKNSSSRKIDSNIRTSGSINTISELLGTAVIGEICDKFNESPNSDTDDFVY